MIDFTEQQMLLEIREDPANDQKRLIYADYMEDTRRFKRAEFIRIQVELARLSNQYVPMGQREKLQARQSELFMDWEATGDLSGLDSLRHKLLDRNIWKEKSTCRFGISHETEAYDTWVFTWVRGFIGSVSVLEQSLDECSVGILDSYPIEYIGLLDHAPTSANSLKTSWYWQMRVFPITSNQVLCSIGRNLIENLGKNRTKVDCKPWTGERYRRVYYKSEQDALLDLSYAILLYGKELKALKAAQAYETVMEIEKATRNSKPFIVSDPQGLVLKSAHGGES